MKKKNTTKEQWKSVCNKWGMNVIRELVNEQDPILEENDGYTDRNNNHQQSDSSFNCVNLNTFLSLNNLLPEFSDL